MVPPQSFSDLPCLIIKYFNTAITTAYRKILMINNLKCSDIFKF